MRGDYVSKADFRGQLLNELRSGAVDRDLRDLLEKLQLDRSGFTREKKGVGGVDEPGNLIWKNKGLLKTLQGKSENAEGNGSLLKFGKAEDLVKKVAEPQDDQGR